MAKGNKTPHPPMVMKLSDVVDRLKLLQRWDFTCLLCGHEFRDISSVTFEHLTPRSLGAPKGKKRGCGENFAPTHYNCNQFRMSNSLCRTMRLLDRHRKRLGDKQFVDWINRPVPHRIIPAEFMRVRTSKLNADMASTVFGVAIPDHLPGMP